MAVETVTADIGDFLRNFSAEGARLDSSGTVPPKAVQVVPIPVGVLVRYRATPVIQAVTAKVINLEPFTICVQARQFPDRIAAEEIETSPEKCEVITLKWCMPHEMVGGEYHDTKAYALRDMLVIAEYFAGEHWKPWPGKHKHVLFWVVLANGLAVGFNENTSKG